MFHVVPERAHDLSRWRLFVAQEVKVSGVLDEIIIWPDFIEYIRMKIQLPLSSPDLRGFPNQKTEDGNSRFFKV